MLPAPHAHVSMLSCRLPVRPEKQTKSQVVPEIDLMGISAVGEGEAGHQGTGPSAARPPGPPTPTAWSPCLWPWPTG